MQAEQAAKMTAYVGDSWFLHIREHDLGYRFRALGR
jgi:hypothetical protein